MSFDPDWLDLREPADRLARDPGLLAAAAAFLGDGLAVDLGCGTGATLRAFPSGARWRLVDRDPRLLALVAARARAAEICAADLADLDALPLDGARLVTASALFDLCSGAWIAAFADRLAVRRLGLYAALSYDGHMAWSPSRPDDAAVTAAFNGHQRRDKGFGLALGPDAAAALVAAFAAHGYTVRRAPSPWRLGPAAAALQTALVDGIAASAQETGLGAAAAWDQARRAASASTDCVVGHADVLALPPPSAQSNTTSVSSP